MSKETAKEFEPKKTDEGKPSVGNPAPSNTVPTTEQMSRLAVFVEDQFRINRDHRSASGIDKMLEYAGRSAKMKYSPKQEQIMRAAGLDPRNYPPLTRTKIRTAKAMLMDIVKSSGDKPYDMKPTPKPSIPKSAQRKIMQQMAAEIQKFYQKVGVQITDEKQLKAFVASIFVYVGQMYDEQRRRQKEWAKERCDRMDEKIHDQFVEGDFITEFHKLINYVCTYGTGLMIGPCPRVVARCECKEVDGIDEAYKYTREYVTIPVYEAVSPWDCYPAPNAKDVTDGTLCIKVRYAANALWQFAEAGGSNRPEGWQAATVRALLSRYPKGGLRLSLDPYDLVRRDIENDSLQGDNDCTLEGIRCFSSVRGSELISFGILHTPDKKPIVHHHYYKTETIVIGGYVVYCRIIDDRMTLPVAKATMYESPDSWWGDTISDLCFVPQTMQNNAFKNLLVNGELTSNGLFVCSDVDKVVSLDGSPALALRAGKMFGFRRHGAAGGATQQVPLSAINLNDTTEKQLKLMQAAMAMADDYSGIPQFTVGSTTTLGSGAGRTASGMAMMSEANCRIVNECIIRLSLNVIVPVVKNTHVYNLLFDDDMSIKGDVDVAPAGLMGKILREAESQRRQQVTAMLGQHPIYSRAIPVEGFFELIRPELENIGVNPDKIIPSKDRMEIMQQIMDLQQAQQSAQGAEGQGEPTPEQANVARVEGNPQGVAVEQGARPGTVAERRNVA